MKTLVYGLMLNLCLFFVSEAGSAEPERRESRFREFISAEGDRLLEGTNEFRFISFNIPNLLCIEDNMDFTAKHAWRLPDAFEIEDALRSIRQMGGTVARTYVITVRRNDDMKGIPRHVLAPGEFSEEAFRSMDQVLALANRIGVRLIIPLMDNWKWMGGRPQYAAFRRKDPDDFWTDPQLKEDFRKTISYVLNRKNTITGEYYKNDKAILVWELGNELREAPESWINEMAAYIKSIDQNHLVNDGIQGSQIAHSMQDNPHVDILSTHHYENDPAEMLKHIRASAEKARGKKPYYVGEFGFISTTGIRNILAYVSRDPAVSGALIWSLRFHNRDGGFYWHSEPFGGGLYKAYHWPGFHSGSSYDETDLLETIRHYGFAVRGREPEAIDIPESPKLLPITDAGSISWQGSAGAKFYFIERSITKKGPWISAGDYVSDASVASGPLFNDRRAKPGQSYYYRVKAWNRAGFSEPSNSVGPVRVSYQVLVDEMRNFGLLYHREGNLSIERASARQFKEDFHRMRGENGAVLIYQVPGRLMSFKIFSFSKGRNVPLSVSLSSNGNDYRNTTLEQENYFIGELDYDYWQPVLSAGTTSSSEACRFLKIECKGDIQIGKIEIHHEN